MSIRKIFLICFLIFVGFLCVLKGAICEEKGKYKLIQSFGEKGTGEVKFKSPCGIAVDRNGYVYVVDSGSSCIQKLTSDGKFLCMWKTTNIPRAITVDAIRNVYVAEAGVEKGLIEKFTTEGKLLKGWEYQGAKYKGQGYSMPGGIAVSGKYVYLGNNSTGSIQKFTTDGELIKSWGNLSRCCGFLDVAVDRQENVYVAELGAHRVIKFDQNGGVLKTWGKSGNGKGEFCGCCNPVHIAIGPKNTIFTSEKSTPRIQEFTSEGKFLYSFGEGNFSEGCGYLDIAVASDRRIFAVDDGACRVLVFGKE